MNYDKVNQAQIILQGPALIAARTEMRKRRVLALRADGAGRIPARIRAWLETRSFRGPVFNTNSRTQIYISIGGVTVNVGVYNEFGCTEYVYPLHSVGRIRTKAKE